MKKRSKITLIIILLVLVLSGIVLFWPTQEVSEEFAKCVGEKAILYTQLGCHACENQKKLFGENYKYLNIVDCWYEREKCGDIEGTPTWKFNEQNYIGLKSLEELKKLTGC